MGIGQSVAPRTTIIDNMFDPNSIKLSDSAIQRINEHNNYKNQIRTNNKKSQATHKPIPNKQSTFEQPFDPNTIIVPAIRDTSTPCDNIRKQLIQCYGRNYTQTLRCRQEVTDFKQCFELYQRNMINKINKSNENPIV